MVSIYQGSDTDVIFTLQDNEGAIIDLTGLSVAVMFQYQSNGLYLNEGYSTGSGYANTVTITDATAGEVTVEFERSHTNTAVPGVLDMYVVVDKGGVSGPANHCKLKVEGALEIIRHALPNVSSF